MKGVTHLRREDFQEMSRVTGNFEECDISIPKKEIFIRMWLNHVKVMILSKKTWIWYNKLMFLLILLISMIHPPITLIQNIFALHWEFWYCAWQQTWQKKVMRSHDASQKQWHQAKKKSRHFRRNLRTMKRCCLCHRSQPTLKSSPISSMLSCITSTEVVLESLVKGLQKDCNQTRLRP